MDIRKVKPYIYAAWLLKQGVDPLDLQERMARDTMLGLIATLKEEGVEVPPEFAGVIAELKQLVNDDYMEKIKDGTV